MTELTLQDLSVDWDRNNFREVEHAKLLYRKARDQGRRVLNAAGAVIENFHPTLEHIQICEPELGPSQIWLHLIDETGDRRMMWDANDPAMVADADKLFKDYTDKGWRAYAVDRNGNKLGRVISFNALDEELLIEDKTRQEGIAPFAKKFDEVREIKMAPRTRPG